jgi:hypothetical protein
MREKMSWRYQTSKKGEKKMSKAEKKEAKKVAREAKKANDLEKAMDIANGHEEPKVKAEAKAKKPCACGCCMETKGGMFIAGHDGRVHGWFKQIHNGEWRKEGLRTQKLQEAYDRWDGNGGVKQAFTE